MCYTYKRVDYEMPLIPLPHTIQGDVPLGVIQIWAGTLSTIPNGWNLCDGLSGRPNLLTRFIRGVQTSATNPGIIGGQATVTLNITQMPSHTHSITGGGTHNHTVPLGTSSGSSGIRQGSGGNAGNGIDLGDESPPIVTGSIGTAGSGQSHDNIPPFFEVAYIIKES